MKSILPAILVVLASTVATCAHALSPGLSGAWFDPAHPGHGFSIEILSPADALVFWYAYDHDGHPMNLYLQATIDGNRLHGEAFRPHGMRFGAFDPADLQAPAWGGIEIDFADCDTATLTYTALDPSFGSGEIALRRLTRIAGSSCLFEAAEALPNALYRARFVFAGEARTLAAVDPAGRLHAVSYHHYDGQPPSQPTGVTNVPLHVAQGHPLRRNDTGLLRQQVQIRSNTWTLTGQQSQSAIAVLTSTPDGVGSTSFAPLYWVSGLVLEGVDTRRTLAASLTTASLAGSYRFVVTRFVHELLRVDISADGEVCMRPDTGPGACFIAGTVSVPADGGGFFDFSIYPVGSEGAAYNGRGWLEVDGASGERVLVMAGGNATTALGIVAIQP